MLYRLLLKVFETYSKAKQSKKSYVQLLIKELSNNLELVIKKAQDYTI